MSKEGGDTQLALLEAETGNVRCSAKAESVGFGPFAMFALARRETGQNGRTERELLGCGGINIVPPSTTATEDRCFRVDFEGNEKEVVDGATLALVAGASYANGTWMVVGGQQHDGTRPNMVAVSPLPDLGFVQAPISAVFPSIDWDLNIGCLARFPGPDGTEVVAFFTSSVQNQDTQVRTYVLAYGCTHVVRCFQ